MHPFDAAAAQVMPPFDIEMVEPLQERMRAKGVQLHLGDGVAGFEQAQGGGLNVLTQAGRKHAADLVMLVSGQGVLSACVPDGLAARWLGWCCWGVGRPVVLVLPLLVLSAHLPGERHPRMPSLRVAP